MSHENTAAVQPKAKMELDPRFTAKLTLTLLGICAVALGAGILIAAIFPVGALMFLVAGLLIACGCACCRR